MELLIDRDINEIIKKISGFINNNRHSYCYKYIELLFSEGRG